MRLTKTSIAAVAALAFGVTAAPLTASAQNYYGSGYSQNYGTGAYSRSYDYNSGRYYDPCARERQGRTGAGAVIGGGAGAVIGSQLAARGRRTEGSILGGVLGAVVGSQVGRSSSDACRSYQSSYGSNGYYDDRSRPVESYQNSDGCRLAESQIRLPDGRTDTRYVRTCPDQYGRYRVVD